MTSKEFVAQNMNKRVKLTDASLALYPHYKGWEGEIVGATEYVKTKTTIPTKTIGVGYCLDWYPQHLEIIEDLFNIVIPENNYPCPRCKSLECKGLTRIECISKI